jgi:hypothetical protein
VVVRGAQPLNPPPSVVDAQDMVSRLLCLTIGHRWDRSLHDGHPGKRCVRCELHEWAADVRVHDPAHGVATRSS